MGWVWDGMGWKSLKGVILRAPLCGANNVNQAKSHNTNDCQFDLIDLLHNYLTF